MPYSDAAREVKPVGIEIGLSAELIDALGDLVHVPLLFLGVLREFRLDAFAGNALAATACMV